MSNQNGAPRGRRRRCSSPTSAATRRNRGQGIAPSERVVLDRIQNRPSQAAAPACLECCRRRFLMPHRAWPPSPRSLAGRQASPAAGPHPRPRIRHVHLGLDLLRMLLGKSLRLGHKSFAHGRRGPEGFDEDQGVDVGQDHERYRKGEDNRVCPALVPAGHAFHRIVEPLLECHLETGGVSAGRVVEESATARSGGRPSDASVASIVVVSRVSFPCASLFRESMSMTVSANALRGIYDG